MGRGEKHNDRLRLSAIIDASDVPFACEIIGTTFRPKLLGTNCSLELSEHSNTNNETTARTSRPCLSFQAPAFGHPYLQDVQAMNLLTFSGTSKRFVEVRCNLEYHHGPSQCFDPQFLAPDYYPLYLRSWIVIVTTYGLDSMGADWRSRQDPSMYPRVNCCHAPCSVFRGISTNVRFRLPCTLASSCR
jgi:hypothetical protein